MSYGSKPSRDAISSLDGRVPSAKRARSSSPVFGLAPPVLADLVDQVRAKLRVPDPGAEIVGRVEAGIHVGEVAVGRVANARRGGQPLGVVVARQAGLVEVGPEVDLELKLRRVAPKQEGLEEDASPPRSCGASSSVRSKCSACQAGSRVIASQMYE